MSRAASPGRLRVVRSVSNATVADDEAARSAEVSELSRGLVERAQRGDLAARAAIFDACAAPVRRVILRVLGTDAELVDCVHETFARAFASLSRLEDPERLEGWLVSIAVHVARDVIRSRARGRWLRFFSPAELPDVAVAEHASPEVREAVRAVYEVLEEMPVEERIAFVLRRLDQRELTEGAEAMGVSLATFKRRLTRAEQRFSILAGRKPALRSWVTEATW